MTHILVVEDESFMANIMRVRLEDEGYKVTIVGDGKEAIEKVKEETPDIILLDLVMPRMDGFDFLKEIRSVEQYKNIPVVVVTNLNQAEDIEKVENLGVTDYIVKSDVSMDELEDRVTELIKKKLESK